MLTLDEIRVNYKNQIISLADKHGFDNVRVFGSFLNDEQNPNSDIDFLVSRRAYAGLWELAGLYSDLEELLKVKVDLVTEGGLSKYLRDDILKQAQPL